MLANDMILQKYCCNILKSHLTTNHQPTLHLFKSLLSSMSEPTGSTSTSLSSSQVQSFESIASLQRPTCCPSTSMIKLLHTIDSLKNVVKEIEKLKSKKGVAEFIECMNKIISDSVIWMRTNVESAQSEDYDRTNTQLLKVITTTLSILRK